MERFDAPVRAPETSNNMAVAGFVVSLLGIVLTAGILCPIGLILSLVALRRPGGRGLAIAGIVLGSIGCLGGLLILLLFGAAVLAIIGLVFVLSKPERVELTSDMLNIAFAAKVYENEHGSLPEGIYDLHLKKPTLNDPWGEPYIYFRTPEDLGFEIVSSGPDGELETDDDIALTDLDETWFEIPRVDIDVRDGPGSSLTLRLDDREIRLEGGRKGGRVVFESDGRTVEVPAENK